MASTTSEDDDCTAVSDAGHSEDLSDSKKENLDIDDAAASAGEEEEVQKEEEKDEGTNANDNSQEDIIKGGNNEDTSAVCSTPDKSKVDLPSNAHLPSKKEASFSNDGCSSGYDSSKVRGNEEVLENDNIGCSGQDKSNGNSFANPSSHTPRQRPRSLSPNAEFEGQTKRPAIICDFYAKGWCIKGSSCTFLHKKVSVDDTSPWSKDLDGAGMKEDFENGLGLGQGAQRPKLYTDHPSSSKSNLSATRLLVREYGGMRNQHQYQALPISRSDPRVLSPPLNEVLFNESLRRDFSMHNMHALPIDHEDFPRFEARSRGWSSNHPLSQLEQTPLFHQEYGRTFGIPSHNEKFMVGKYPHSMKSETGEYLSDEWFRRGSSLATKDSLPEYRHLSSIPFGYDKNRVDSTILRSHGQISLGDANLSSALKSPSQTSFSISPSHRAFSLPGASSTHGSSPLNTEQLGAQKLFDGEKGFSTSRLSSLSRGSSPHLFKFEGDPTLSRGFRTTSFSSDWEPSVPFRSSFCSSTHISSPGSQYDPILDSIEPGGTNLSKVSTFSSTETIVQDLPHQQTSKVHVELGKNVTSSGVDVNNIDKTTKGYMNDGENGGFMFKEEHSRKVSTKEVDMDGNSKHLANRSKPDKDSKALKLFRVGLVDCVKELVKPSWRGGHLSKDDHKTVVKKAVEKVVNSLQPHQIPSTAESIDQYLSSSRPKLVKLVEGYVEKCSKARAANT